MVLNSAGGVISILITTVKIGTEIDCQINDTAATSQHHTFVERQISIHYVIGKLFRWTNCTMESQGEYQIRNKQGFKIMSEILALYNQGQIFHWLQ